MTIKRYLDLPGLTTYDTNIKAYIHDLIDVEAYDSLTDFPTQGRFGILYIATSTAAVYVWSAEGYFRISVTTALTEKLETAYTLAVMASEHANIKDGSNPHKTLYQNIVDIPEVATASDIASLINGQNNQG